MRTRINVLLALLMCSLSGLATGQSSEGDQRRNVLREEEIIAVEHRSAQFFLERDWEAIDRFLGYEFQQDAVNCGFEGKQQAIDAWVKSSVADNSHPTRFKYSNLSVRFVDGIAVVTGKAEYAWYSAPGGAYIFTDVLAFRNKAWILISGHSSNIVR